MSDNGLFAIMQNKIRDTKQCIIHSNLVKHLTSQRHSVSLELNEHQRTHVRRIDDSVSAVALDANL